MIRRVRGLGSKHLWALAGLVVIAMGISSLQSGAVAQQPQKDLVQRVQDRGELRVAYVNQNGYAFKGADGQWHGVEYDAMKLVAEWLGVKLVPVESTWTNVIAEVQSGKADLAMPGLFAKPQRALALQFTDYYRTDGYSLVIRKKDAGKWKTIEDINNSNHTVAVSIGSTSVDAAKTWFPKAKVNETEGNQRFQEVGAGRADGAITDVNTAVLYAKEHSWATFFPPDKRPFGATRLVIGVPYGEPRMLAFLNASVEYMKTQGILQRLGEKYGVILGQL